MLVIAVVQNNFICVLFEVPLGISFSLGLRIKLAFKFIHLPD